MHPPIEPYAAGHLRTGAELYGETAELYWEISGNPDGAPALHLHGGPGSGLGTGVYRRLFDPRRYRIVGLDQRGCGRSRPLITDELDRIDEHTTGRLIADIEELRTHLGIDTWVLHGVSWGSTLALAYAQEHPDRVRAIVLTAVTTTSREEVDWITEEMGRIFPEAWHELDAASRRRSGERIIEACARLLRDPDPAVRAEAALAWDRWEATHISLGARQERELLHEDAEQRELVATLVSHYWSHDAFLTAGSAIAGRMDRIASIPGTLIHGRVDISGPAVTPWRLHQAWPASTLHVVADEGHGGPRMWRLSREALDALA